MYEFHVKPDSLWDPIKDKDLSYTQNAHFLKYL